MRPSIRSQCAVAVDKVMLQGRKRMYAGQRDQGDRQGQMDIPGDVGLSRQTRDAGRNAEETEDIDGTPVRGRDQIASRHHGKQQDVQEDVRDRGGDTLQAGVCGLRRRAGVGQPPTESSQHEEKQEDPHALMNVRRPSIPGIVVGQLHHPQTQREEADDNHGHQPVQHHGNPSVAVICVSPHDLTRLGDKPLRSTSSE